MRILFLSNYYPPCIHAGGYAQLCQEVAEGLAARGHAVEVLTSTYGSDTATNLTFPVHRMLSIDPDWHSRQLGAWQFFVERPRRERQARAHLDRLMAQFDPDVVFIWQYSTLPRVLLQIAEQAPGVVTAYYLADYLPELADEYIGYWQLPPVHRTAKLFKPVLRSFAYRTLEREGKPIPVKYENVICVSHYVRERLVAKGLIPDNAVVIHNGVDLSCFSRAEHRRRRRPRQPGAGLRCLVAGRLVPDKGIHTVIEALAHLRAENGRNGMTLTILGDGPAAYLEHLQQQVDGLDLRNVVEFRNPIPREQMPHVLADHDVLILSSEYAEPLARAMQEAMAMGLLVIGTTTGGSGELLVHQETGLVFEPGDPESLAAQLISARADERFAATLAENGYQIVAQEFSIEHTIERIEQYLQDRLEAK